MANIYSDKNNIVIFAIFSPLPWVFFICFPLFRCTKAWKCTPQGRQYLQTGILGEKKMQLYTVGSDSWRQVEMRKDLERQQAYRNASSFLWVCFEWCAIKHTLFIPVVFKCFTLSLLVKKWCHVQSSRVDFFL